MTATTVVRNADWLVACDSARSGHVYLRDADLAFDGDVITHVGRWCSTRWAILPADLSGARERNRPRAAHVCNTGKFINIRLINPITSC